MVTAERRSLARFPLQLLVRIEVPATGAVFVAETKDVSAGGIYVYTTSHLDLDEELELLLTLPQELTQSASGMDIACKARVLRVNPDLPDGRTGIAAEIYSYDFLAQAAGV